jgi:chromosome segregation protein
MLKDVEIYGFKSFAARTRLEFGPGITAIVGPNGCGKTNIVEAVRWALGEQRTRELREIRMEDVIFKGSEGRRPISMAEVSVAIDNSSGFLPIDYREIEIRRKIFRDGRSEYFINKTPCRLKDIEDLLADTGLGIGGYAFMNQRHIDLILAPKPSYRKAMIEEASGIVKYKMRKAEAISKLEATNQNLLRINDILSEIRRQKERIEEQARTAREYQRLKEELERLEIILHVRKLSSMRKAQEDTSSSLRRLGNRLLEVNASIEALETEIESLRGRIEEISSQISALQEERHRVESDLESTKTGVLEAKEKLSFLEREEMEASEALERAKERLFMLEEEEKNLRREMEEIKERIERARESVSQKGQQLSFLDEGLGEKERILEEKKAEVIQILKKGAELGNRISDLDSAEKHLRMRGERIRGQRSDLERQGAELEELMSSYRSNIGLVEDEISRVSEEMRENEGRLKEVLVEIDRISSEIEGKRIEIGEKRSRLESLKELRESFEGYRSGAREILRSRWPGVIGSIADIIEVPEEYEGLFESVLEPILETVVVESAEVAKGILERAEGEGIGRISLLPLDSQNAYPLNEIEGIVRLSELVSCEERFRGAVDLAFGRYVLVDDIERAFAVISENPSLLAALTADGKAVWAWGAISGGKGQGGGILSRAREIRFLELGISDLLKELEAMESRLSELMDRRADLELRGQELARRKESLSLELESLKVKLESSSKEKRRIEAELSSYALEEERIEEEIGRIAESKKDLEEELSSIRKREEEVNEEIKELQAEISRERKGRDSLISEISEMRISISSWEQRIRSIGSSMESIARRREQLIQDMERSTRKVADTSSLKDELRKRIENGEGKIKGLSEELKRIEDVINELKGLRRGYEERLIKAEGELRARRRAKERLQNEIAQAQIRSSQLEIMMENIMSSLASNYGIGEEDIARISAEDPGEALGDEEMERMIEEKKGEIESLGIVNIAAIREYEELSQRVEFLESQRQDLEESRDSLVKLISKLDREANSLFKDTFERVRKGFKEVFSQLFDGGEADLIMVGEGEEEGGIEIVVRPPGKRDLLLGALSAGERTLVAIAFLFALLGNKPAPFCIMDEVDATLDDINVDRFIRMLRYHCGSTQFIIVTHNKRTMEAADALYGVTMEEPGVSKVVSVRLLGR